MLITCKIKNKNGKIKTKRELIELNKINNLDACMNTIESVINDTVSPLEDKLMKENMELKNNPL